MKRNTSSDFPTSSKPAYSELPALAIELAAQLLDEATRSQQFSERMQGNQMARMMDDTAGKAFTFAMADQVFRPPTAARRAKRFRDLIDDYGVPEYLPLPARIAMRIGEMASTVAPEIVMPLVAERMRQESASVILPAEEKKLRRHLQRRQAAGIRMNLNQLGEAVLGEEEARHRLNANLTRLADPDVDYISVKISAIYSQIHLVALSETLEEIKIRLRQLYKAAMTHRRADGGYKFVNLDMEEYRDLRLTCSAFQEVLDEPEFYQLEAGIVLQAYLPDAWPVQQQLNAWAIQRVDSGKAGIKIRVVKGANLAMENVDAETHDWPQAPYHSKVEVDANFKRMIQEACQPENARAVRLGIASHNLFDIAYGMILRDYYGVADRVEFEMLEGMANHQARVVRDAAKGLLLYAPVVNREDFHSAIAYLVRRLDENTSPENFLHDLFGMSTGDAAWERQKQRFLQAYHLMERANAGPYRIQNRDTEKHLAQSLTIPFHNTADTDWSLPHNVAWIRKQVDALRSLEIPFVPLQIAGNYRDGAEQTHASDPSRPGHIAYRHALGGADDIEQALQCAESERSSWNNLGWQARGDILSQVAVTIAARRGEAIATMVLDAGKSVMEADAELSEAIDFANYYARSFYDADTFDGMSSEPLGTVLITPPWNFPYAIPCGGILAALVAGNTVIFKPAPETVLTGWIMVQALWDAGVPRKVLQFLPCPDNEIGRALVTDPRIAAVVLTGAYETARMFLSWKPQLCLYAETSGKNALIITASADPDLAVKDLVKSAFGHSGQKCSAASLAIIEGDLYDDPNFHRHLRDAAASLNCGPSWNYKAIATPIIREPGSSLHRALTTLDDGEEWLLEPKMIDGNPCLWSPGIKRGVTNDSWFRKNECFGPVLGLMRANNLDHAIQMQNSSEFGLTGGIHALDPKEIDEWRERAEVGNAYVNRPITGAIVQRQPFGGWKRSCFGPGAKAGGPNYVAQFATWTQTSAPKKQAEPSAAVRLLLESCHDQLTPEEINNLTIAAASDAWWMAHEFSITHDPSALTCEANMFRYRAFTHCLIRVNDEMTAATITRLLLAAKAVGLRIDLSLPIGHSFRSYMASARFETEECLIRRLGNSDYGMIRTVGASRDLCKAAIEHGIRLIQHQPVLSARLELLGYFREQSISETRHRHGSVIARPEEID